MASNLILLQGGTLLVHGNDDHIQSVKADLLIEGSIIAKIEAGIKPSSETKVIDCTDKIISPGFIDTHHHVWQTLQKGRHANELLLSYMASGNLTNSLHTPSDIFWGELGGVLECLDVGTTTVVDHAHLNYSPEHSKAAIAATLSSGIRSVFCYCPTPRLESWEPFTINMDLLPPWVMSTLEELVAHKSLLQSRVQLGFAFDGSFLPKEVLVNLFDKVKSLGIKVITTHYLHTASFFPISIVELYHNYGILDHHILFSHCSGATETDAKLIQQTNSHLSSTPSTELQMALGIPVAFSDLNLQSQSSVGADCHSNQSASIPSELRLLLQSSRALHNEKFISQDKIPKKVNKTVEEAFNLGTIQGARAIGRESELGSLAVGKKADILIWDATTPGMVCAAEEDPVAAIVLHSSPGDLETTIVDGVVWKEGGKLKSVDFEVGKELWDGEKGVWGWKDVSKELMRRRVEMAKKFEAIDIEKARKGVIQGFYIDESKIVDSV